MDAEARATQLANAGRTLLDALDCDNDPSDEEYRTALDAFRAVLAGEDAPADTESSATTTSITSTTATPANAENGSTCTPSANGRAGT